MRDKRAIIIKDPNLRKIRNNLRTILLKAVSVRWRNINDKRRELKVGPNGSRRTINNFSEDEVKQYRTYQDQQSYLRDIADRSICKCITCGASDRDMVYNKTYDSWYCTECYNMHRKYAQKLARERKKAKSEPQGHEDRVRDELSRSFL